MTIDVPRARRETPGCEHVVHLNNAGAALMPRSVVSAYTDHIRLEARIGGYEAADAAHHRREKTYRAIAELIGSAPDEIALLDSATRAWNMAFYGLALRKGDRILTSRASYASNFIAFLHRARRDGVEVDVVPTAETGEIDVEVLDQMAADGAALIALTHVPTNGGLVNPAEAVGRVARRYDIPFLLDACQSAGQTPLDVDRLKCDMLSATGRKFLRGPRGTGFLYVRSSFLSRLDASTPDLHSAEWIRPDAYRLRDDARRFELWESSIAADIALGVAVQYALDISVETAWKRITKLAGMLRARLAAVSGITVHDIGRVKGGIVTFSHDDLDAATIKRLLQRETVNVSVSEPNSTLLDAESRHLPSMVRASVHYYNSEGEIDKLCALLTGISS